MKISFDHVLANLFQGTKPGMDHTPNTLELAQKMSRAGIATDMINDPPLTTNLGMSLSGLLEIQTNKDIELRKISNNLPKQ